MTVRIPLVVTLHGSDVSVAEQKPWFARLARRPLTKASVITAPSTDLLDRAARLGRRVTSGSHRTAPTRIVFRPDPDGAQRVRRLHGIADDDVLVLGVGRFVRWKGFDDLIASVAQARRAGAGAQARPRRGRRHSRRARSTGRAISRSRTSSRSPAWPSGTR